MYAALSLKSIIALVLVAAVSTMAVASTVAVGTTTYQTQSGVQYNVSGYITAVSNGFEVAPNTVAANNPAWTSGSVSHTALTAGDWVYSVNITLTSNTATSTSYTIEVQWIQGNTKTNLTTGIGPTDTIIFTTPASAPSGQYMTFLFDTGSSSFSAPAGIIITVGP